MYYLLAIAIALIFLSAIRKTKLKKRKLPHFARSPKPQLSKLDRWTQAESRDVVRPHDPRTKFCFEHLGQLIVVKYHGHRRKFTPLRVFTKPQFRKTYVLAVDGDEQHTFDIDDMELIPAPKKSKAANEVIELIDAEIVLADDHPPRK